MAKTCKKDGCGNPVFGGGYCRYHQQYRTDKTLKRIKNKSERRKVDDKIYSIKRRMFLDKNKECCMCKNNPNHNRVYPAVCIHHKYHRIGKAYLDENTWIASCIDCNGKVEEDPVWAYKHGYLATPEEKYRYYNNDKI